MMTEYRPSLKTFAEWYLVSNEEFVVVCIILLFSGERALNVWRTQKKDAVERKDERYQEREGLDKRERYMNQCGK